MIPACFYQLEINSYLHPFKHTFVKILKLGQLWSFFGLVLIEVLGAAFALFLFWALAIRAASLLSLLLFDELIFCGEQWRVLLRWRHAGFAACLGAFFLQYYLLLEMLNWWDTFERPTSPSSHQNFSLLVSISDRRDSSIDRKLLC